MKPVRFFFLVTFLTFSAFLPQGHAEGQRAGDPRSKEFNEKGVKAAKEGKIAEAEELLRKALVRDPRNVTAAYNLAGIYLREKKEGAALTLLEEYVQHAPQDPALVARLGDAYFAARKVDEAIAAYEKVHQLDPKSTIAAERLGTLYVLKGKPREAQEMLRQAAALNPKDTQVLSNLSSVLLANGSPEESVAVAKRALQIRPSSDVYVTLGNAYAVLNDPRNALIAFQRARDLGNSSHELEQQIVALQKALAK